MTGTRKFIRAGDCKTCLSLQSCRGRVHWKTHYVTVLSSRPTRRPAWSCSGNESTWLPASVGRSLGRSGRLRRAVTKGRLHECSANTCKCLCCLFRHSGQADCQADSETLEAQSFLSASHVGTVLTRTQASEANLTVPWLRVRSD